MVSAKNPKQDFTQKNRTKKEQLQLFKACILC